MEIKIPKKEVDIDALLDVEPGKTHSQIAAEQAAKNAPKPKLASMKEKKEEVKGYRKMIYLNKSRIEKINAAIEELGGVGQDGKEITDTDVIYHLIDTHL